MLRKCSTLSLSPTVNQSFQIRLRHALQSHKISVIARRSGYDENYIRSLREGRKSNPTISFVWAVAGALGVSPAWLLGLETEDEDRDVRERNL